MLYGIKAGDTVLVVDDPADGKPIVETAAPGVPEGYYAAYVWEDQGSQIVQVWSLKPIGEPLPETLMTNAIGTAGDLENASTSTLVRTCMGCCGRLTVVNNSATASTIVGANPAFYVKRVA